MDDTNALTAAFEAVGKEHGYGSVSAEFAEFKEFKIKWRRSLGWIEFEASDYLKDAPENVLKGIAEMIFSRISRRSDDKYSDAMLEWMTSDTFVKKNRPMYLKRAKNLARTPRGTHKDLSDSYKRLVEMGLAPYDDDLVLTWTKQPNVKRIGYCSVLMKVIAISSIFDTTSIPDFVLDFVLYHELIHLGKGFDPFDQNHDNDFRALEEMHPMRSEAEDWLKRLRLYL